MDGVKETARSSIDEGDFSSNKNLRDQMDGTSVRSPRKSPRLMAQEPARSLRQSTLAKRSPALLSAKKPAVKPGAAQKAGLKQQDKGLIRPEDSSPPEHPKEIGQPNKEPCQEEEATEVSSASVNSEWATCCPKSEEVKLDSEHKIPNQAKILEASHGQDNSSYFPGSSLTKEPGSQAEVVAGSERGSVEPGMAASSHAETNQIQNNPTQKERNETVANEITSEVTTEEKTDHKPEEELNNSVMDSESNTTGIPETPHITPGCENASGTEETLAVQSSTMDGKSDCSSGLQASVEAAHQISSPEEDKQEPSDGSEKDKMKNDPVDSMEVDPTDSKSPDAVSAKSVTNVLEGVVQDIPVQVVQQQNDREKMKEHETTGVQEDKPTSASSKCIKNVKSKHAKGKQNKTVAVQKKPASINREVHPSQSSVSLKRNAEEQGNLQHFHKPAKVKKKHENKDLKVQSCDSGMALKKQPAGKSVPRPQIPIQVRKTSTERATDNKPVSRQAGSKEAPSLVSGSVHSRQGQLPHNQKQLQKHPFLKANNCVKEEAGGGVKKESMGVPMDHLREDEKEKFKLRKLEKSLQPRQRRSSKSLSVDEPPLFIPDNISTVKRESSDHQPSSESKSLWVPSKQCGFCKKPHGNRFMVGCGRCDDWFHGDCVGLSLSQAQQMGEEDKEYVCVKCCAEEDKKPDVLEQNVLDTQLKLEPTRESRTVEYEKPGILKQTSTCPPNKTKLGEDYVKHKVKIFKRESGEGRAVSESKDSDMKKGGQIPIRKMGQMPTVFHRSSEDKQEKNNKDALSISCPSESTTKSGFQDRPEGKKKRAEKGGTANIVHPPSASASKPSTDQIRQSVRQSLRESLEKRLADSTLKIPEERAAKVASRIEKELFSFFRDTDSKYKNKYRSLIFNLKDPKNNILFKRVLKGDVTPDHLIRMSPEELASKELAAWRKRENRHTIEMIEKEQREVERRPITKITHKGEIEIESETPVKEQEGVVELQESVSVKGIEKMEETEKDKEVDESATPDTTSQHKHHLFDLNCKICIGRMAPPSDDLSGKKVKVSVGVARKPSDNEAESIADALSSTTSILASELLEEDNELPTTAVASASTPRSETPGTVESETLFLARLSYIWKGFINMPSVAKFVIKAYPISGSFENLTEDLPDSIQVGGRISPQTVWEYVEKIKATGTKEICVVRFTPVTEEDQISYTLLFAYFSSRKRYGVAANNMKQIKDLYIIPLGASDKIPHQLVPFDGPGIEVHRPNLLLGLIIRQKLKRQINAVGSTSTSQPEENLESGSASLPPEKKSKLSKPEVFHSEAEEKEDENDFFNSFTAVLHKQRLKSQLSVSEEVTVSEPSVETVKHEPPKPLRFLPGVLVGWENQSSALEFASKPLPVDDILQSLLDTTGQMPELIQSPADQTANENLTEKQINVKEEKIDIPEITPGLEETKDNQSSSQESTDNISAVDIPVADVSCSSGNLTSLSLKGKPPDVSTEAFLANLAILSQNKETKEAAESSVMLGGTDNVSQEDKRTTNCPVSSSSGKALGSDNAPIASVDTVAVNSSKSPQFINLKRDPRQAGRSQQNNTSESEGDSVRNEDVQNNQLDTSEMEETNVDNKQSSGNDLDLDQSSSQVGNTTTSAATKADGVCSSQLEETNHSPEKALMQNIETVQSIRRGLLPPPPPPSLSSSSSSSAPQFETENSCQAEFSTKIGSPVTSGNFSPMRTQQPNFQPTKTTPPAFQFQGAVPPNFPPQNNPVFGFPPHLPPPLLPPPGFGFAQAPLLPWPPGMHLSGQPPHFVGPVVPAPPLAHKPSRFSGPEHFYQSRDNRRPDRRHSDPWGRQDPHLERTFSRRKSDQHRQRFYSDSHHQKKGRHDWEPDSDRNRPRDRTQDKERDRKSREEGHRDKERSRLSHGEKDSEGKSSRESRNPEKKDASKSEEWAHEKEKEREKSRERHRERDSEKHRDRHHKDRDHSDRSKSKR
ncbi:PHD finger protein 3 isoform X2 [Sphaerodactylus townsendi]|nr:PHD finger protein 3 isoform X2 [Sphaerodactylus townsendi]XP_048352391.1 PHD finger protein 3 isoform X2 [Sphaerodactylus townsendi]XP_048352400.1 PHD finger protein 3 isoform X2 [Sphaerodactylus townsendi]